MSRPSPIERIDSAEDGHVFTRNGSSPYYRIFELHRGVTVLSYKVDMMLGSLCKIPIAIECDGHQWHDRTKQQAAYDRARDRELLGIGVVTIRFTGSEIVHAPDRCASEVWTVAQHRFVDEDSILDERLHLHLQEGIRRGREAAGGASIDEHW